MTNFMIATSGKCDVRTVTRRSTILPFLLCLLPALTPNATGQQPAVESMKELTVKSANGKPAGPEGPARRPKQEIDPRTVDRFAVLRSARVIFVRSKSLLVGGSVVEDKLQKRPEFDRFGLVITRDADVADLVLELRHDLFTMYVYTAVDPKTQVVVASGKLSSLGGTVADKVAKRFLKQMTQARSQTGPDRKD